MGCSSSGSGCLVGAAVRALCKESRGGKLLDPYDDGNKDHETTTSRAAAYRQPGTRRHGNPGRQKHRDARRSAQPQQAGSRRRGGKWSSRASILQRHHSKARRLFLWADKFRKRRNLRGAQRCGAPPNTCENPRSACQNDAKQAPECNAWEQKQNEKIETLREKAATLLIEKARRNDSGPEVDHVAPRKGR